MITVLFKLFYWVVTVSRGNIVSCSLYKGNSCIPDEKKQVNPRFWSGSEQNKMADMNVRHIVR